MRLELGPADVQALEQQLGLQVQIVERPELADLVIADDSADPALVAREMLAQAEHIPVHLGSMGDSVQCVIRQHAATMAPGDAYVLNVPYNGGTHLPDITVVCPI